MAKPGRYASRADVALAIAHVGLGGWVSQAVPVEMPDGETEDALIELKAALNRWWEVLCSTSKP